MEAQFLAVTALVPAGANLEAALELYRRLGFAVEWESPDMAGVRRGNVAFNLVRNDNHDWANNTSFSIGVTDLNALYEDYAKLHLRIKAPALQPWGRLELHMLLPSGVCLQFYEVSPDRAKSHSALVG